MKALKVIFIILFLYSCKTSTNNNVDIKLDNNTDTLQVTKRYLQKSIKEIIIYKNNKPNENIGFSEKGDTIDYPKCIYVKSSDSLYVFIPINKYQNIDIYFRFDSLSAVTGIDPKLIIENFKKSAMVNISPEMYKETNVIDGAIKCWDSINKTYKYFPFIAKTE
jgi:hypothetical protein